eukprot:765766-Hanusia_phi.AAC.5
MGPVRPINLVGYLVGLVFLVTPGVFLNDVFGEMFECCIILLISHQSLVVHGLLLIYHSCELAELAGNRPI